MPGPPPPSKSYLLKIIDSSDEEDEEEVAQYDYIDDSEEESMNADASTTTTEASTATTCSSSEAAPAKKRKKKKKKKKKKKNKSPAAAACTTEEDTTMTETTTKKTVSFGSVTAHSFERVLGTDVVPYDGGWPLGLGDVLVGEVESTPVDDYETTKQERLRIRAQQIEGVSTTTTDGEVLETRQWDYKYKAKNPLFHLLQEEQRMNILLLSSTPEDEIMENSSSHHGIRRERSNSTTSTGTSSTSASSSSSKSNKRRDSKNKNGKHNSQHPMATRGSSKRERSGSFSSANNSNQKVERYNETFPQVLVHHVRNELEELRFQRGGVGHAGCTCRKLDVYLLPPNAGKKAHHRRMNVKRVKDELKKRHLLPDAQTTRDELELLLHRAVEEEACCSNQECPCVRNGIECQADVCACWHDSHQAKQQENSNASNNNTTKMNDDIPVEQIQERCGNANGMYTVDLQAIQGFRRQLLEKTNMDSSFFICPPVSQHTPIPQS